VLADVRDAEAVEKVFSDHGDAELVLHLAGQVAVTRSLINPREDFEANALGTFNVLEAMRRTSSDATLIFSSTNKVYGSMDDLSIREEQDRYSYEDLLLGVNEDRSLDFHSPYGCSKGAADQYVRDYSRIYGLKTVVFRQSCIYGPRQFGVEDQGWVAWFLIAHASGQPVTIYGDGKQVRDILFIDDLINCYLAAIERIDQVAGMTFNIGGGPRNTLSLLELLELMEQHSGVPVEHSFEDWRPGDQPLYISDISKAKQLLEWQPKIGVNEGLKRLQEWVADNSQLFARSTTSV